MILVQANEQDEMSAFTVIIALTSGAFEEQQAMILRGGCDDFMRKPFQENQLFEKMSRHLGVRYLYKAEEPNPQALTQPPALTKVALNVMPIEWLQQLYQAALAMDDQLVVELTQQIPPTQTELTNSLLNLVDNFRLDVIIDCLDDG
jgi:CheY-like chemotaxis protein